MILIRYISLLQRWEVLVLSKLKWDISAITPQDFLCHILTRIPIDLQTCECHMVRRHAQTFIALCARGKFTYCGHHYASTTFVRVTSKSAARYLIAYLAHYFRLDVTSVLFVARVRAFALVLVYQPCYNNHFPAF